MLMIVVMRVLVVVIMSMVMIVVMVVMVLMHILADLFLSVDFHFHVGAVDTAFHGRNRLDFQTVQAESVHFCQKFILICKFAESCHQHVAGSSHPAFQIKCSHIRDVPF